MEHPLFTVILQLTVIMAMARIFAALFKRIGQPGVCGEMAAGLILGPSFIGKFFPRPFHRLFDPAIGQTLTIFSQVGLVLLLFLIGMEFEFSHLRSYGRKAAGISLAGIIIPFGAGLLLAKSAFERLWPVFVFQVGDSHNVPIETKG